MGYIPLEDYNLEGTGAWDGEFTPPKPGSYLLKVCEIKSGTSNDKIMVSLKAEIMGTEDGRPTDQAGKFVYQNYFPVAKEKAKERFVSLLNALGLEKTTGFDPEECVGRLFTATVTTHNYEGRNPDGSAVTKTGTGLVRERRAAQSM